MSTLEKIVERQRRKYEKQTIWEITGDEMQVKTADAVIANLVLGKISLQQLLSWILESGAKEVSLVISSGEQEMGKINDIVREFQGNGLDLMYMREISGQEKSVYLRMDFKKVW